MHEDLEKELSKQTALAQNGQSAIDTNMRLSEVIVDLQSCYKEAMELLEAAIKDLHHGCHTYKTANESTKSVTCKCVLSHNWRWRHADRYEALKQQSRYTPH